MAEIIVAVITASGILTAQIIIAQKHNSIVLYRLKELEKKQDKHNGLIAKMYTVEESLKSAHHRIEEIREDMKQ